MSDIGRQHDGTHGRRRFIVHLLCLSDTHAYVLRIRPYNLRGTARLSEGARTFADDCDLIATINPLLPSGSDVRDIFDHIESSNGFYYLLNLTAEEAARLGWVE
ncbi:hypothetical protein DYQ86_24585 [Acidobacteria bacterium AB60]|nr:hypothetical protein DYQ86_24585 [Acidobacteria bacterium AB60]